MIPIRRAGDTGEGGCESIALDTVARCGATLVGDFAHIGPTDDVTGWTQPGDTSRLSILGAIG